MIFLLRFGARFHVPKYSRITRYKKYQRGPKKAKENQRSPTKLEYVDFSLLVRKTINFCPSPALLMIVIDCPVCRKGISNILSSRVNANRA